MDKMSDEPFNMVHLALNKRKSQGTYRFIDYRGDDYKLGSQELPKHVFFTLSIFYESHISALSEMMLRLSSSINLRK